MIWELRNADINKVAILLSPHDDLTADQLFSCNGQAKVWDQVPTIVVDYGRMRKKKLPRADISHLWLGSIVLNQRAYAALHPLLSPFGQLLELDCEGSTEYFYNVTNVLDAIDVEKSEKKYEVVIDKEVFLPGFDGDTPLIFKAPQTVRGRLYANQAARTQLEQVIARENLTGLKFSEPGSRPY